MKPLIGIIGGSGAMGTWFERFFKESGFRVIISDLNTELTNEDLVMKSDVVIISTPIEIAVRICKETGPLFRKDQLLMDLCSQKEDIVNAMLGYCGAEVVGLHPMFGPFTDSLGGQNVIVCPVRVKKWARWVEDLFEERGGVLTSMDPVDHDRHMALVQGLTHFLTICMGRTMQKMNMKPEETVTYSTPIFRLNCELLGRLFAQDLDLYATLVGENKYVAETLHMFRESMDEVHRSLIDSGHEDGVKLLLSIREHLGDYCSGSLERSNEFLNVLFDRAG